MRVKVDYRSTSKEVYDKFCKANPNINISYLQWKKVIYSFNELFRKYILETGEFAKMPWGFGEFTIQKKKKKRYIKLPDGREIINLPVDWKRTKEAGKKIYHMNFHTDGYSAKWFWSIRDARFYMKEIWVFKPSRYSSRALKEYLLTPGQIDIYKEI